VRISAPPGGGKREVADEIAERTHSAWVGLVGFIAILYRQQEDPEKQTIDLPA
jgi:RNA-binding protein YhbY